MTFQDRAKAARAMTIDAEKEERIKQQVEDTLAKPAPKGVNWNGRATFKAGGKYKPSYNGKYNRNTTAHVYGTTKGRFT
jgi:hypothetical protein